MGVLFITGVLFIGVVEEKSGKGFFRFQITAVSRISIDLESTHQNDAYVIFVCTKVSWNAKKLTEIPKLLFCYSWFFSHSDYFHSDFVVFAVFLFTVIVIFLCIVALEVIFDNVPCSNRSFVRAAICKEGFAINQLSDFFRSSECLSFSSGNRGKYCFS